MSIAERAGRVRERFADIPGIDGIDALLVSDLTNIRWLTGFSGSNGWVLLDRDQLTLVTDGRYGVQAAHQLAAAGVAGHASSAPASSPRALRWRLCCVRPGPASPSPKPTCAPRPRG